MSGIDRDALATDLGTVQSLIELIQDILRRETFRDRDVELGVRALMLLMHPHCVLAFRNAFGTDLNRLDLYSEIENGEQARPPP